ncbi:MerR family transcriptional regulator [Microbacterium sp. SA39]|uniref:MerR family transcriptional regulator n=1 Tax=Microbacterium sp. SA39 TaxID=1263625 RepID=UPI000620057D|nr:MerR family transcriptional regulator [Microbacterium sp. SA39]KJQ52683.1 HTH-type transcriptional activator TipA [Microbacterium sp. SA39]
MAATRGTASAGGRSADTVAWSTRELADLAGTTLNTVRHYHSLGLLDTPERNRNGYKQYQVTHLVQLLQVRRIAELGVPLSKLAAARSDSTGLRAELRQVDAAVAAEIERLCRARSDIAAILDVRAPIDAPRGFETVAAQLSESDLALIHICARVYSASGSFRLREMVAEEPPALRREFDGLSFDAEEATRQLLVRRMAAETSNWRWAEVLWSSEEFRSPDLAREEARRTIGASVNEFYNAAQSDVLRRVSSSLRDAPVEHRSRPGDAPSLFDVVA